MNELTRTEPEPLRSSMLAVIARASTNPDVSIEKMEALLAMQERMEAREAKREFDDALDELNRRCDLRVGKLGVASMGGKGSYKYVKFEDLMAVVFPVMRDLGLRFAFQSTTGTAAVTVNGKLVHRGGHSEATEVTLPFDFGPGRNSLQAVGSAISYAKRYCAELLLNVVREDEDDDGQAAGTKRAAAPTKGADKLAPLEEPNGTIWLKNLQALLAKAETIGEVAEIRKHRSIVHAMKSAPAAIKSIIDDDFRKAEARLAPQDEPTPEETAHQAGTASDGDDRWADQPEDDPLEAFLSSALEKLAEFGTKDELVAWSKLADVRNSMTVLRTQAPKQFADLIGKIDARQIELDTPTGDTK